MTLQTSQTPATNTTSSQHPSVIRLLMWPLATLQVKAQQRARDREIRALYRQVFGTSVEAALSTSEAKNMVRWRQSRAISEHALVP